MNGNSPVRLLLRAGLGIAYAFLIHAFLRGDSNARHAPAALAALLLPALVSAALGVVFATTLRPGAEPMIARVAQAMDRDPIPPRFRDWLRGVTVAWCVFFATNTLICTALALFAPVGWWTLWNGVLVYAAIAALLLGEYVIRKIRFRWYRDGLLDRFWRRAFPPSDEPDQGSGPSSSVT
jgi:uncharacterized membrane protein